jgi:DNA-binding transcriptional ArsR family regulator
MMRALVHELPTRARRAVHRCGPADCVEGSRPLTYNQMVVDLIDAQETDRLFNALADATRRDIVVQAMRGEHSVSNLARRYPMSITAVQKHVAVLERARLVTKERRGREQIVRINIDAIHHASHLLDELEDLWRGRVDRISELIADGSEGEFR